MFGWWRDTGQGLRSFFRRPVLLAAIWLSLMLGIGANTAIFTLLDKVFLHSLPGVDRPDRLVAIYHSLKEPSGHYAGFRTLAYPNYLELREQLDTLEDVALFFWQPMNLSGGSDPERVVAMYVTANYFPLLGIEPARGRFIAPEEDSAPGGSNVLVLGHGCWRRAFGADPGVIDRKVVLNGQPFTVVGIAPPGFKGTELAADAEVFIPLMTFPKLSPFARFFDMRGASIFRAFGRLAPGATVAQADAEMMLVSQQLASEYPADLEGLGGTVMPLQAANLRPEERPRLVGYGKALMIAVGVVLLVAAINVASLLVVRAGERTKELALRRAVGASRWRVVRQLLAENLGLFLLGGLLSLPVARWCLDLLWSFRPPQFPADAIDLGLDLVAIFFAFGVTLVIGLIFGLVPALGASSPDLVSSLKAAPGTAVHRRRPLPAWLRPHQLLVVVQIALALVASIAAGLFVLNLRKAQEIDLGFDAERLAVITLSPGDQGQDEAAGRDLYRRVLERFETLPGVRAVGLSENRLLRGGVSQRQVFAEGREEASQIGERSSHRTSIVGTGFFKAVGIALREGRDFDTGIAPDAPPEAIINETMARSLWPGESAVGKRFHFDYPTEPLVEVVGVVADTKYREIQEPAQFFIYLSLAQSYPQTATLHVRTDGDPADLLPTLRREIHEIDPNLPLVDPAPLGRFVDEALWLQQVSARLYSVFGVLAILLAALGIYGVLSHRVHQRRRELGIRLAIGAGRGQLVRTVLTEAAVVVGAGLALGWALAWVGLEWLTAGQLGEIDARDPLTYGVLGVVLAAIALIACWLPARRASRVDPVAVLRTE